MKVQLPIVTAFVFMSAAAMAAAEPGCTCRYQGEDIPEGQIICAHLPSGDVMIQCSRVLNNTSWKTLRKGCPTAMTTSPNPLPGQSNS